ncbi:MAG: hypothetical protein AVDCRST_MAG28-3737 [uncultured Rubrobacteraceae bacterium]|uniref:Alkaline phosphatase n=1 Tax=uncultured Rubrobacteraceae bacterium TaxID=349277 RepID=A0A6J4RAZ4_9ACTN|nr:MAG: hypothetical protein AVDCRST_MAG28-3737 [uncultured Rubrobacteraceae bacterium]
MRRAKLVLGVLAVMMAMTIAFAAPTMAEDRDFDGFDDDGFFFIVDDFDNDDFCDFFDCNDDDDFCYFYDCEFDGFGFNDGFGGFEQEAESGDIDQSFEVTGVGDNANQTVNVSGVANTGNLQDQSGFTLIGSDIDEFEIDDVGSSLEVSGSSEVSSEQAVNQAASSK